MGNHWHLVAEVFSAAELGRWMRWLCQRHARRHHRANLTLGGGHVYQGRFKSFPIQDEAYLYAVLRYVEANPLRAGLVAQAQDWPWSSLSGEPVRNNGDRNVFLRAKRNERLFESAENIPVPFISIGGGISFGASGGGRLMARCMTGKPSTIPPSWNPFADQPLKYDPNFPGGSVGGWLGEGPTPQSAAGTAAMTASGADSVLPKPIPR